MSLIERAIKKQADRLRINRGSSEGRLPRRTGNRTARDNPSVPNSQKWANQEIDAQMVVRRGLAPEEALAQGVEEQFLRIKRPVLANAFGPNAIEASKRQLVMITSALPGEGKTFCSWNFAVSVSKSKDQPVILVDADALKPKLSRDLQDDQRLGFLDILERDDLSIDDVLIQTDQNQMQFIPSGKPRARSSELFMSRRAGEILAELAARVPNGLVVFDSSPLLLTNESKILSGAVGQILLVVAAGATSQAAIAEAVSLVDEDIPMNVIFNKYPGSWNEQAYGYGYGYGYGQWQESHGSVPQGVPAEMEAQ